MASTCVSIGWSPSVESRWPAESAGSERHPEPLECALKAPDIAIKMLGSCEAGDHAHIVNGRLQIVEYPSIVALEFGGDHSLLRLLVWKLQSCSRFGSPAVFSAPTLQNRQAGLPMVPFVTECFSVIK